MSLDYTSIPEEELIQEVTRGYIHAYGELYKRYRDEVYRYIYFRYVEKEEVGHLTQKVFVKAWEILMNGGVKNLGFRTLCYQLAHQVMVGHLPGTDQESFRKEDDMQQGAVDPLNESLNGGNEVQSLIKNIRKLDTILQELVICRFVIELSLSETADVLGLSHNDVRALQYRALKKIQIGEH